MEKELSLENGMYPENGEICLENGEMFLENGEIYPENGEFYLENGESTIAQLRDIMKRRENKGESR